MTKPFSSQPLNQQQAMRYSRQLMLPALDFRGQEALLASKVLLVGMGGLGCAAAPYLVVSGIGSITLADDDTIDRSNLQRQILYREADIGQSKAGQAAAGLRQLNSEIEEGGAQRDWLANNLESHKDFTFKIAFSIVLTGIFSIAYLFVKIYS